MERENLKIFEEFRSHAKPEMLEDIRLFLGVEDGVGECRVEPFVSRHAVSFFAFSCAGYASYGGMRTACIHRDTAIYPW